MKSRVASVSNPSSAGLGLAPLTSQGTLDKAHRVFISENEEVNWLNSVTAILEPYLCEILLFFMVQNKEM